MENLIKQLLKLEGEHGAISQKVKYALQQLQKMRVEDLQDYDMTGTSIYEAIIGYIILSGDLRERLGKEKLDMLQRIITKENLKNLKMSLLLYEALADKIKPYTNHPQVADLQLLKQATELSKKQDQMILKIMESFPTSYFLILPSNDSKEEIERLYREIKKCKHAIHNILFESDCLPDVIQCESVGKILLATHPLNTYAGIDAEVQSGMDDDMQSLYEAVNVNLLQVPDSLEKREYQKNMLEMQKMLKQHQNYQKVLRRQTVEK